jgi:tRNA 2-thiouridine synthesizing protein A
MENASAKSAGAAPSASVTTLDLTGLKCPLPVLKARRQISQMAAGERLDVMADDPAAPLDFEHFCSTGGHALVETRSEGDIFTFCICVGTGPAA